MRRVKKKPPKEFSKKMLKTLYAALDSSGGGKSGYEPEKW